MHASGTSRFGFSTAEAFCDADSMPRKAHSVSAMEEPMPSAMLMPFGFHAAAKVSALNQIQPAIAMKPTGRITPQTVTEPMRPVQLGPPKFATVVNHSSAITPTHVAIGVADSAGKTLLAVSTLSADLRGQLKKTSDVNAAKQVGLLAARRCLEKGIARVVFDRNGFVYHGRVRAVAEGAREGGLQF